MTTQTHPRAETIDAIIDRHAEAKGADATGTEWAKRSARNGLAAGLHESEAIYAAFEELRLWMEYVGKIDYSVADACIHQSVRDSGMEAV